MKQTIRFIILFLILLIVGAGNAWSLERSDIIINPVLPNASAGEVKLAEGDAWLSERTVKIIVTPAPGFKTKKSLIIVEKMVDPTNRAPQHRTSGIGQFELTGTDNWITSETEYTFTVPEEYDGAYITATFVSVSASPNAITSLSEITDFSETANYELVADIDASGLNASLSEFKGTLDGKYYKIYNLSKPLFASTNGAIIRNIIFEEVNISESNNVGAVTREAKGASRIYNIGILSGSVGGTGYTGGLVGLLKENARVINCYSYANITNGTTVAGIVGRNDVATTAATLATGTMVMNCMFYGDITGGTTKSPVYGGNNIDNRNSDSGGLNTFNYYCYENLKGGIQDGRYYCALAVEKKYLTRIEFYRQLLNSNKKLAAYYASTSSVTVNPSDMAKWVLETADRTITDPSPFPVLKAQGRYPSIINYDAENAPDSSFVGRNNGGKLGRTLTVHIGQVGSNAPNGASIIRRGAIQLERLDKDTTRYNFNYDKVQLPYYNDVGTGNYTGNKVVTGWKITSITAVDNDPYSSANYNYSKEYSSEATYFDYPNYNFADRKSSNKDLYSVSGRVFSQGAYFDVPYGVTSITIEPYWGNAAYVADEYLDVVCKMQQTTRTSTSNRNDYVAQNVTQLGKQFDSQTITINGSPQTVYTSISAALNDSHLTGSTVYDNAVVLVGNLHQIGVPSDGDKPFTMMSVDLDKDNEPDCSLIYCDNNRCTVSPIRFDFLNIPGMAQAQKPNGSDVLLNAAIFRTLGWFEITNTAMMYFTQYEYENTLDITKSNSPLILLGGYIDQFVSTQSTVVNGNTIYIHVGSNVLINSFGLGTHSDGKQSTPHVPVSVTGGDYIGFYLTGTYNQNAYIKDDNAECYISGGHFGELAGAAQEQIGKDKDTKKGNVRWQIYDADITEFYGGGVNDAKPVQGNITTDIFNSHVGLFCGGPKFGNMTKKSETDTGKSVTTTAVGCTFGKYFGAGYGGISYSRKKYYDATGPNWNTLQDHYTNDKGKYYDGKTTELKQGSTSYGFKGPGVATDFDYEYFVWTSGAVGGRFFVKFASFSLAQCNNVESKLTRCIVNENFYGGGSLGKVTGTATSRLTDCTVHGNVYGGGYSATIPQVPVRDAGFKNLPSFNKYSGMFVAGEPTDATLYDWKYVENLPADGTTDSDFANKKVVTATVLTTLGEVGNTNLTITGTTTVDGNVYGGGEESGVAGSTTVEVNSGTIGTGSVGSGDVFGAGKGLESNYQAALVKGNSTVTMTGGTVIGSIYGGGELASVGTFTFDTTDPTKIIACADGTGTTTVAISGGAVGNNSEYAYDSDTRLAHTHGGNVFAGCKGVLQKSDGTYISDWIKFARVRNTVLTVSGEDTRIMSNIYGGGEIGSVGYLDASDALVEGCGASVTVSGGTIGTEIKNGETTQYTFGSVFGGGRGSDLEITTTGQTDPNAPKLFAGRVYGNTSVTMSGGAVKASVYGGGELASVSGNATVTVSGGSVGIPKVGNKQFGGATMGNVYGGGSGNKNIVRAGQIFGNTIVSISETDSDNKPTHIYHNVYGGGAYGSVGTFKYSYTYEAEGYDGIAKVDGITSCVENTGTATVTITGGIIGTDGTENGMIFGSSRGDVGAPGSRDDLEAWVNTTNVTIGAANTTGPTIKGSVYGSGENGHMLNDAAVTVHSGTIGVHDGTDADATRGNVYGGGCGTDKYYENPADEKYDGNGDKYNPKAGIVEGNTTVAIDGGIVLHNVYGAGAMGSVGKTNTDGSLTGGKTTVTITGGRIGYDGNGNGNVFGAARGKDGISDAASGLANVREAEVNINYTTTPSGDNEGKTVQLITGSVFGGGEAGTVKENVVVNMRGGLILKDIYGGGALADTQISNWDVTKNSGAGDWTDAENKSALHTTTVRATGGRVVEEIFGGGLGEDGKPAFVWGDVLVDLNGETTTNNGTSPISTSSKGCIVNQLFGCNNVNGSPKGDVLVHVHATQNGDASKTNIAAKFAKDNEDLEQGESSDADYKAKLKRILADKIVIADKLSIEVIDYQAVLGNDDAIATALKTALTNIIADISAKTSDDDMKIINSTKYDVHAVYGGGNLAAYKPVGPNPSATDDDGKNTTKSTKVIIDGCGLTSIETVYGGGNAASTPATETTVNGTYEIYELFGGGNGKDAIVVNNVSTPNPGANVGFYDYSQEENTYNTKEKRTTGESGTTFIEKYVYGTGKATVNIFGGTIHRVFGGSNTKGNVRQTALTLLDEGTECPFCVDEAYGGGKSAEMDAEAQLLMACIPGLEAVYGGAEAADVHGNVTLNITNGTFDRVFGGNNLSGTIGGAITINVEEIGCKPVKIGELYGGGNEAGYSVYGYDSNGKPVESGTTPLYNDPQVNVMSFTSIGNIYGGGYGSGATMVGNPTVNINVIKGKYADSDDSVVPANSTTTGGYPIPSHATEKIGAINNVFGGGNAAKVIGNTTVNVGTLSEVYVVKQVAVGDDVSDYYIRNNNGTYSEASDTAQEGTTYYEKKDVIGADIRGNVYGGGNNAEVTGNTNVQIGKKNE
ncbi:MAG: hypothetical protein J6V87_01900 [Prevotella sp.]|nr:hypothetical protein [Prevotella sp.]